MRSILNDHDALRSGLEQDGLDPRGELERAMVAMPTVSMNGNGSTSAFGRDDTDYGGWTQMLSGGPDVNPELMGRAKFPIYREMKMTDAAIRSLSWLYKLPIRSAEYGIEPAKDDPDGDAAAAARADWVACLFGLERHNLPMIDLTWDQLLQMLLLYVDYGSMGAEMIPGDVVEWYDADGDPHLLRPISRLAPRMPSSVERIEVDADTGLIREIQQDVPKAKPIPGERILWLVSEREGENWFGVSPLRAAWGPWSFKRQLMISGVIAYDRWSAGIPIVRHPPGEQAARKAQSLARSIRSHERAWGTFEGPSPADGGDWSLEIVNGASSIADPVEFLRYLDQQIAVTGLQQFSSLGMTQTGSRAVGEVLVEPFYMAVQSIAKEMVGEIMRSTLGLLWKWNFAPGTPIPEIVCSKIQGQNIALISRAIADLATAGLSFTDRDTQNDVRDLIDFRHLPEPVQGVVGPALDGLPSEIGVQPPPPPVEGGSILPPSPVGG